MKQLTKALLLLICAAMCIPALGEEAPLTRQWYLEQTLAMARDVQALAEDEGYLSSYLSDSEALAACTDAAGMRVQEDSDFLLISIDEALLRTLFGDEAEVILPLSENLLRMLPRLLILPVTNQQDASSMARFSVLSALRYWNLAVEAVPLSGGAAMRRLLRMRLLLPRRQRRGLRLCRRIACRTRGRPSAPWLPPGNSTPKRRFPKPSSPFPKKPSRTRRFRWARPSGIWWKIPIFS